MNKFYASEGRQKYTFMNPINSDCKVFGKHTCNWFMLACLILCIFILFVFLATTNVELCFLIELPASSLANYFHTNCQSGVREMKLTLDGALELTAKNPLTLKCSKVSMLSDYSSGSKVCTRAQFEFLCLIIEFV